LGQSSEDCWAAFCTKPSGSLLNYRPEKNSVSRPEPHTFSKGSLRGWQSPIASSSSYPKFQKAGDDSRVERPFSRRTLHDGYTSRRGHGTFPQTFLRESLSLRVKCDGPSSLQSDSKQSLTRTALVRRSNLRRIAKAIWEECSRDLLFD